MLTDDPKMFPPSPDMAAAQFLLPLRLALSIASPNPGCGEYGAGLGAEQVDPALSLASMETHWADLEWAEQLEVALKGVIGIAKLIIIVKLVFAGR